MHKQVKKFFSKHVVYNSAVHILAGVGVGILIAYPLAGVHPIRWGLLFLGVGITGHLIPLMGKD